MDGRIIAVRQENKEGLYQPPAGWFSEYAGGPEPQGDLQPWSHGPGAQGKNGSTWPIEIEKA
jgi:hypothetical protein